MENVKKYVNNKRKYVENMKEYVGSMKDYVGNLKKYVTVHIKRARWSKKSIFRLCSILEVQRVLFDAVKSKFREKKIRAYFGPIFGV